MWSMTGPGSNSARGPGAPAPGECCLFEANYVRACTTEATLGAIDLASSGDGIGDFGRSDAPEPAVSC